MDRSSYPRLGSATVAGMASSAASSGGPPGSRSQASQPFALGHPLSSQADFSQEPQTRPSPSPDTDSFHDAESCSPCRFFRSKRGCKAGDSCKHCHYPHADLTNSALRKVVQQRSRQWRRRTVLAQQTQEERDMMLASLHEVSPQSNSGQSNESIPLGNWRAGAASAAAPVARREAPDDVYVRQAVGESNFAEEQPCRVIEVTHADIETQLREDMEEVAAVGRRYSNETQQSEEDSCRVITVTPPDMDTQLQEMQKALDRKMAAQQHQHVHPAAAAFDPLSCSPQAKASAILLGEPYPKAAGKGGVPIHLAQYLPTHQAPARRPLSSFVNAHGLPMEGLPQDGQIITTTL